MHTVRLIVQLYDYVLCTELYMSHMYNMYMYVKNDIFFVYQRTDVELTQSCASEYQIARSYPLISILERLQHPILTRTNIEYIIATVHQVFQKL